MLDQMYEMNVVYFKELSMYIIAGKRKLEEVRSGELAELMAKAQASSLQESIQVATIWKSPFSEMKTELLSCRDLIISEKVPRVPRYRI